MADNTNFEFAKIIANNYTVEEQPMWDAATENLRKVDEQNIIFDEETIIDVITLAYIPNVGRLDVEIIKDDMGGIFGSL